MRLTFHGSVLILGGSSELGARTGSRSNGFYLAPGFEKAGESERDGEYRYRA